MLLKQLRAGHQHAWNAIATLDSPMLDERRLQWMESFTGLELRLPHVARCGTLEALNGCKLSVMRLRRRNQAGHNSLTIEPNRTCPAFSLGTTFFGSYEAGVITQRVKQTLAFRRRKLKTPTIDGCPDDLEW